MQEKNDEEEKLVDVKGVFGKMISEEPPELSQEEAIKEYKGEPESIQKKSKKNVSTSDDEENSEEAEHLKRIKQALLESLERVNLLAKKLFGEKDKDKNLENIKVKTKGTSSSGGKGNGKGIPEGEKEAKAPEKKEDEGRSID